MTYSIASSLMRFITHVMDYSAKEDSLSRGTSRQSSFPFAHTRIDHTIGDVGQQTSEDGEDNEQHHAGNDGADLAWSLHDAASRCFLRYAEDASTKEGADPCQVKIELDERAGEDQARHLGAKLRQNWQ